MIQVKNVTKKYGKFTAVDNISFTVKDGEVVGFLGPNGAGKSTTMNMITGFIEPTNGTIEVNGYDIMKKTKKAKMQIGYMPENVPLYMDLTVKEFLNKVAGSDPVPGGGSIAALNGAVASALAAMVANLTIGKKNYEEHEELMNHIASLALREKDVFIADIDRDSEAYDAVFACFKMPKATDEEKAARSAAIQEATKYAALVPMQVARNAYELMSVIADVARLGNRNAVTDACVAMMSARTAVLGALLNVRINLGSIKDKTFADELQREADVLERMACDREKEVLDVVNQELRV